MTQYARVDAPVARDIGVADSCCYHLDQKLILLWFAREQVFPFPVVLRVGDYAFAGDCVFDHFACNRCPPSLYFVNSKSRFEMLHE